MLQFACTPVNYGGTLPSSEPRSQVPAQPVPNSPPPLNPQPAPNPQPQPPPLTQRFLVDGQVSGNAMNVLKAAFATDYSPEAGEVNAYDFPLYHGHKGMDWWNFPWDLPSTKPQYMISYDDMKELLTRVKVRKAKDSPEFVRYGRMLAIMVAALTPQIMNEHGGYLRVVKIIYCVRNFLAVAKKYNLVEDISYLKQAAKQIIAIYKTNQLVIDNPTYTKDSSYKPKNIDGIAEDRTSANGVADLEALLK